MKFRESSTNITQIFSNDEVSDDNFNNPLIKSSDEDNDED